MQTQAQRRAKFALERVRQALELEKEDQKKFRSYANSMPTMVHTNGLGQTAAFFLSKPQNKPEGRVCKRLYEILSDWLTGEGVPQDVRPLHPYAGATELIEGITSKDMQTYLAAQAEAIEFLEWVKKFARAFMAAEEDED